MGLFGISRTAKLKKELAASKRRIKELEALCEEKDSFFQRANG